MCILATNRTEVELQPDPNSFSICNYSKLKGVSSFVKGIKAPLLIGVFTSTCTKLKHNSYRPVNVQNGQTLAIVSCGLPFLISTQETQACTCCDDTHLMNANLKMNTNTPFESENIWASRERGSRPKAGEAQLKRLRSECPQPHRVRYRNKTEAAKQTPKHQYEE